VLAGWYYFRDVTDLVVPLYLSSGVHSKAGLKTWGLWVWVWKLWKWSWVLKVQQTEAH